MYLEFTNNDTFSDRLIILLFHFAFILKNYKKTENKKIIQHVYDNFFKNLELNMREIGYGDLKINKSMKNYVNLFYSILNKTTSWNKIDNAEKESILSYYLEIKKKTSKLSDYFNRFDDYLKKTPLNYFSKGVIKHNF